MLQRQEFVQKDSTNYDKQPINGKFKSICTQYLSCAKCPHQTFQHFRKYFALAFHLFLLFLKLL